MSSKLIVIAATAVAVAFPVTTATAKPGNGHSKQGGDHGNGTANGHSKQGGDHGNGTANGQSKDGTEEESTEAVAPAALVKKGPGKPRAGSRNYVARGTVSAVDVAAGLVSVDITSGPGGTNHAALLWRGQTVQFNATDAFLSLNDTNGDQVVDLNDLAVGARAQVQAFLLSTDAQPYPARRLTAHWSAPALTSTTDTSADTSTDTSTTPPDTSTGTTDTTETTP
jgi:hypothetical protein